jgi:integrase
MKGEGSLYQNKDKVWIYQYQVDGQRKTKRFKKKSEANAFIKALAAGTANAPAPTPTPEPSPKETKEAVPEPATESAEPESAKEPPREEEQPRKEPTPLPVTETPAMAQPVIAATPNVSEIITLGDWMDRWLEVYIRPTVKLSTYCSYELYIRGHIKPNIGGLYMNTLRVDDLQAFFNDRQRNGNLKGEGGLSPKTLLNMRNMMHLAFTQAVRNRLLFDNPVEGVRVPRLVKNEMRVLNREEQDRLITAVRLAPEPAAFGIIFDLFTGLRLGELCGLRWKNVYLDRKMFVVCETRNRLPNHDPTVTASTTVKTVETTKTDNSRRTVYLMDSLLKDLRDYKSIQDSISAQYPIYNPDGYVFCQENGNPYEPRTYQDLFKRCVRQAGIRDANFHALRHTFSTRSLEEGMDIVTLSRLLGHANPSITMDKYGHSTDEQKLSSVAKLDGLYAGAGSRYRR